MRSFPTVIPKIIHGYRILLLYNIRYKHWLNGAMAQRKNMLLGYWVIELLSHTVPRLNRGLFILGSFTATLKMKFCILHSFVQLLSLQDFLKQ
jgi:hypothetical protein